MDLEEENHRLQDENQELIDQLDKQEQIIQQQQHDLSQQSRLFEQFKAQQVGLESKYKEFANFEKLLQDANHRNCVLVAEIERLNQIVFQQSAQVEEWKNKCTRLEFTILEYRQYDLSHKDSVNRSNLLADEVERLKDLLQKKHIELLACQEELRLANEEIEELKRKIIDLDYEIEQLRSDSATELVLARVLVLSTENERLRNQIKKQQASITAMQEELDDLNTKYDNQLRANDDLRTSAEANEKKAKIAEQNLLGANQEIERLKEQLRKLQEDSRQSQSDAQKQLQDQLDALRKQISDLQKQIRDLEEQLRDKTNKLRDAEQRIEILEKYLRDAQQQLDQERGKPVPVQMMSSQSNNVNANANATIKQLQDQIAQLQAELNRLRNLKPGGDDSQLRRQIQDMMALIVLMSVEIENLRLRQYK